MTTAVPPQPTHLEQVFYMLAAHTVFRFKFLQSREHWLHRTNLVLSQADIAVLLAAPAEQITQQAVALRETLTPEGIAWFSELAQGVLTLDAELLEELKRSKDPGNAQHSRRDVTKGIRPDRAVARPDRFVRQERTLGSRPDLPPLKPK